MECFGDLIPIRDQLLETRGALIRSGALEGEGDVIINAERVRREVLVSATIGTVLVSTTIETILVSTTMGTVLVSITMSTVLVPVTMVTILVFIITLNTEEGKWISFPTHGYPFIPVSIDFFQ